MKKGTITLTYMDMMCCCKTVCINTVYFSYALCA